MKYLTYIFFEVNNVNIPSEYINEYEFTCNLRNLNQLFYSVKIASYLCSSYAVL